jgi:hypothetical protein
MDEDFSAISSGKLTKFIAQFESPELFAKNSTIKAGFICVSIFSPLWDES